MRLEDGRAKKAEWERRYWQLESEKITGRLQGMTLTEKREAMEMMEMGDELRDIDGDIEMGMDDRARKRTSFARKSCLKFKGRLRKVAMEVDTLGTIQEEVANWHTVRGSRLDTTLTVPAWRSKSGWSQGRRPW